MWKSEWDRLSARIAAITGAAAFLALSVTTIKSQPVATNTLIQNCEQTARLLGELLSRYRNALPEPAREALARFQTLWNGANLDGSFGADPKLQAYVVVLASIRSELDQLFADHNQILRSHVKRAFEHLRRSLIVDIDLRKKWVTAFKTKGETSCERLGGVHLLLHGIWAFKVSAAGERTDLVLGTRLAIVDNVAESALGLALTEWKVVRNPDSADQAKAEAKHQAKRYAEGSLSGFELRSDRYLVLVGRDEFPVPADETEGAITYRVVPIVLEPKTPSESARRSRRKSKSA
jgi:hypothetical protein